VKGSSGLLVVTATVAVAVITYFVVQSRQPGSRPGGSGVGHAVETLQVPADPNPAPLQSKTNPPPGGNVLENLFARVRSGQFRPDELARLRKELLAMNPDQASAMIRAFLETGEDAPTNEEFTVGPGGGLEGAPTFRTLLLDVLGQIARTSRNPVAAAVSKQVLTQKQSSDEWALAMRNVAWMEPQSKPYLAGKMREMLAHEPWRSNPSAGMLEAFDVIVFSGDPAFVPDLANLLSNGTDELRRASAVALDRLSEMAPLEVMNHLNANPMVLADKPFMRADFYAKADLSNGAQRAAVEAYLNRTDVSIAEKSKLLKALVTPASFISENLITQPPKPEADNGAARLQQLSKVIGQWQAQGRYPELRGQMAEVQARLGH
jgi:hypothetical protein